MKKGFLKRLVAFSMAAVMLFGEVDIASAAQWNEADGAEAVSVAVEALAEEEAIDVVEATDETEDFISEENVSEKAVAAEEDAAISDTTDAVDETVGSTTVLATADEVDVLPIAGSVVCGSNGIAYENVSYLSLLEVSELGTEQQNAYIQICDEIADVIDSGIDLKDVELSLSSDEITVSYRIPFSMLCTDTVAVSDEAITDDELLGSISTLQTLIPGSEDYYKDQLSDDAKSIYVKAQKSMVKGNSNSISWTKEPTQKDVQNMLDAFSALIMTYPDHFDWVDKTSEGGIRAVYTYSLFSFVRDYKSIMIVKSKYYSSSLVSKAKKKAETLTKEAYTYAETNFPDAPSYGIVKYFNDWICANNYYNDIGTYTGTSYEKTKDYYYCHSSIGCLLQGYGVCESYALAMNRLLDTAGIPNVYVVGKAGDEGHAWNYVQMPNGKWYLLDTTWNDTGSSTTKYFLVAKDSSHKADGRIFSSAQELKFVSLSSSKYSYAKENFALDTTESVVAKGKKLQLAMGSDYFSKFTYTWVSSDPKIAKVDKKGVVKASKPGKAVISCKIAGKTADCTIYVYQFSGLKFDSSNKAALSTSYGNQTGTFGTADMQAYTIQIGQTNEALKAADIVAKNALKAPTAVSKNTNVADVTECKLNGDNITLKVQPKAAGTTKITVTFEGKKANLTLRVAQQGIQESWFDFSTVTNTSYTGKAIKPKIVKSDKAPADLKFKVSYLNNKAAGTASVIVEGKGKYGGTITKTFTISN